MSLTILPDGWMQFGQGKKWRLQAPGYLCEVGEEGHTPNYANLKKTVAQVQKVKEFYRGKIAFGTLNEFGYGLDVLTANSFTESLGTVPSPLSASELRKVFDEAAGDDPGVKLDAVIRYIAMKSKYLERREPGYINPVASPSRVSVGAHHVLISTALDLTPGPKTLATKLSNIIDLVVRLPAESKLAAEYAVRYFEKYHAKHLNQPPLLAATYNAGSPRLDTKNSWNLKQYGEHIDRWIAYFNTSRSLQ